MIKPMLTTLVKEPFDDKNWIFEIKWDGYRAISYKTKKVQIFSRNEKSFNDRFPELVEELKKLPGEFIVDGEIVILDKKSHSKFQLLQNYKKDNKGTLQYYLFDILSYEGNNLRQLPLIERKLILKRLLEGEKWKYLRYSDHVEKFGKKLFKQAKKKNLEGIIAKKKDSFYLSKRSKDWLKIKTKMRQEVVIGGFTKPQGSRKHFGALLVGVYQNKKLVYSGHVGGGFNQELLKKIHKQMLPLISTKCPFVHPPRPNAPVTWIKPKLICEIAFAEWTKEDVMRQPIFQGMRIDKSAKTVIREDFQDNLTLNTRRRQ